MSRVREVLNRREAGFSLVEVLVSFVLLALAAASLVPLFVLGATAATTTRMQTQAKNIAQERLEQMRQLAFHVDRQNGPFVDLLDYYYPNLAAASGTGAGWVSETSTARLPGEPTTGAFYRVVLDPLPSDPDFVQTIATQFLRFDRDAVPQAAFATYDSQVTGVDSPPSLFLGVSVITTWTDGGEARRFETFTQISDPGAPLSLIATQARAIALRAESTGPSAAYLTAQGAEAYADGRLSDGSSSAVTVSAGQATRTDFADTNAATATAVSPTGDQPGAVTQTAVTADGASCGYAGFGRSRVTKATSTITSDGVPMAPADVGPGEAVPTNQSQAALLANPGGTCGAFWFDNLSASTAPALRLISGRPLVSVAGTTSGDAPIVEAKAWINGTAETDTPRFVRAGASASTPEAVGLFHTGFTGATNPLVRLRLDSSEIVCDSRNATPATASYAMTIEYRTATGSYESVAPTPISWSSTSGPVTDPLAGIDLTTKVVHVDGSVILTLADYISSWSLGTSLDEGDNGVAGLDAALRITTVPVRGNADPSSSVGLTLGALSCVADDNR